MKSYNKQSKVELATLKAVSFAVQGMHPVQAWQAATREIFSESPSSQNKACPKSAFLGLAGAGFITGIPPGEYTTSSENRRYAEKALKLLQTDETLVHVPNELWGRVMAGEKKQHNGQMNVVIALWKSGKFVSQGFGK